MTVQGLQEQYTNAADLVHDGKYKDAYTTLLQVIDHSTRELHGTKFVHHTLVRTSDQCELALAIIKSCVALLEGIVTRHPVSAITTPNTNETKKAPPLPPKPPRLRKPALPPKPVLVSAPAIRQVKKSRHRGNSVSFTIEKHSDSDGSDHDSNDMDTKINTTYTTAYDAEKMAVPIVSVPSATAPSPTSRTRTIDTRPRSLTDSEKGHINSTSIDVVFHASVDPSVLVPAQSQTGDSLALPTDESDQVPLIPTPPLLTTHKRLQRQLEDYESVLRQLKSEKKAMLALGGNTLHGRERERVLDNDILHKTNLVAQTRETLNKVRTLYMTAATIPSLMQFPPDMTAYQLTLIESAIFRAIPDEALLSHSPRTPHPKVVVSTDFFNYLTRLIEHSILLPQEASRRAELINRWIKIASKCLCLNNYQTLKAIVSALGTPPVQRLERTWDCIPRKRMSKLDLMTLLMSEADNYRAYRSHMVNKASKPVVPFLGLFIYDITYSLAAKDDRYLSIIETLKMYKRAPAYPPRPSSNYLKMSRKSFHPATAITNALHRSSSQRSRSSPHTALLGIDASDSERELDLEQQLITQYLLMRPWVSEKVIDELSRLREPAKPKRGLVAAAQSNHNSSGSSSGSSHGRSSVGNINSLLSNASSLVRLSSASTITMASDDHHDDFKQRGFWPFRRSMDTHRSGTLSSSSGIELGRHSYMDDDDDDDDEDEDDIHFGRNGDDSEVDPVDPADMNEEGDHTTSHGSSRNSSRRQTHSILRLGQSLSSETKRNSYHGRSASVPFANLT